MKTIENIIHDAAVANYWLDNTSINDIKLACSDVAIEVQRWIPKTEEKIPIGIDVILMQGKDGKRQYYAIKFESAMDMMLWMENTSYTHWRPIELT